MWLINTKTLELERLTTCPGNAYAILSHTWGSDMEESNFEEFRAGQGKQKVGYRKIVQCCARALDEGLSYAWVDTCCINKDSSAELSEAINSMFNWYKNARVCYALLDDVDSSDCAPGFALPQSFAESRWFTRGWTLQELIAPTNVLFWDQNWVLIGARADFATNLNIITGISEEVLLGRKPFLDCSIAQRMSWAAHRHTARIEDTAYCLIGLFEANIPLQYGEGSQAFLRLQQEIMRHSDDETIFAWIDVADEGSGLLASSPAAFREAGNVEVDRSTRERSQCLETNRGLRLDAQLLPYEMNTYLMPLRCSRPGPDALQNQLAIFLCRTSDDELYRRVMFQGKSIEESSKLDLSKALRTVINVPNNGRSLVLAPHGGLANIKIETNMSSFQLLPPRCSSLGSSNRYSLYETKIRWVTTDMISSATAANNKRPSDLTQHYIRPTTSEAVQGLYFFFMQPKSLVPCGRYILRIGFDLEFNPTCQVWKWPQIRQLAPTTGTFRIWWCYALTSLRTLFFCSNTEVLQSMSPGISRLRMLILKSTSLQWRARDADFSMTGDRRSGYSVYFDSTHLRSNRCTKVNISCTQSNDLNWQITFKEETTHQHTLLSSIYCLQRRLWSDVKKSGKNALPIAMMIMFWLVVDVCPVIAVGSSLARNIGQLSSVQASGYVFFFVHWPVLMAWICKDVWRSELKQHRA